MKPKILLIVVILFIFINSCSSSNLSNERALEIIKEQYEEYCYSFIIPSIGEHSDATYRSYSDIASDLQAEGLLGRETKPVLDFWDNVTGYMDYIEITEKGKKLYKGPKNFGEVYKVTKSEAFEIIGINLKDDKAKVIFKAKEIKLPFYDIVNRHTNTCELGTVKEVEIEMEKFDTGWNIVED